MPLDLSVPARVSASKDLEIRPKQVKAWIDALPLAQTFDSARKITGHLAGVNRAKMDIDERLQILEIHRPVADLLIEELDGIYAKAPQPMAQRGRDALAIARTLASELAIGYKIVLVEKASKRLAFGVKKQLPALALRAMQWLAAGMRASYKAYSPVPEGVWKEFHNLYVYAEEEGIVAEAADPQSGTIAALYCESLLLSLTDPYRLLPGEVDKVVGHIRSLRAPVTLAQRRPPTPSGGHFIVPCDTDKPPKPALSANDETGGPRWRLFDANAIVERLRARKQAFESGNVSSTMTKAMGPEVLALVTRLITLWGDPPKRVFRRDDVEDGSVAICFGVKNIAHFVAHDALADAEAEGPGKGLTMPLRSLPEDETGRQIPIHEWAIINHSEGGIKVRRTAGVTQPLAVGEVVGVKSAANSPWRVGVARWIMAADDGAMEFGVQFYATAACAVWLQPALTPGPQAKLAILLAHGEELDGESLLTPPGTYAELREFELVGEEFRSRVRATGLIEKTFRFDLFHVSPS